jgi:hypothetical protein
MKWISKLFGPKEVTAECVETFTRDDLRVTVNKYLLACGHPCFFLELFLRREDENRWLQIGLLHQDDGHAALELIMDGTRFIDRAVTELLQTELIDD